MYCYTYTNWVYLTCEFHQFKIRYTQNGVKFFAVFWGFLKPLSEVITVQPITFFDPLFNEWERDDSGCDCLTILWCIKVHREDPWRHSSSLIHKKKELFNTRWVIALGTVYKRKWLIGCRDNTSKRKDPKMKGRAMKNRTSRTKSKIKNPLGPNTTPKHDVPYKSGL